MNIKHIKMLKLINYDQNGNIFIQKDNKYYLLDINKDDEISLEEIINSNIINNFDNTLNKQINKQNILHIRAIENAINELEEESDDEKDDFNDIYNKYNSYKYNPEQRFYHDEIYDENSDDDINTDRNINLYGTSELLKKVNTNFDIPSYETLIINGDLNNTNLIFRTEIQNDQALYRITIYLNNNINGFILLNIIGTKIIKFSINFNTLEIKKEDSKYIK